MNLLLIQGVVTDSTCGDQCEQDRVNLLQLRTRGPNGDPFIAVDVDAADKKLRVPSFIYYVVKIKGISLKVKCVHGLNMPFSVEIALHRRRQFRFERGNSCVCNEVCKQ